MTGCDGIEEPGLASLSMRERAGNHLSAIRRKESRLRLRFPILWNNLLCRCLRFDLHILS